MKKLVYLFFVATSFFAAFSASAENFSPEIYAPQCFIETLPASTVVYFELNEKINSEQATIGQIVQFKVRANVTINGAVLVKTGAMAIGRVKSISPTTFNNPTEITLELTTVQSVDGQLVALNGIPCTFKGQFSGEAMTVFPGANFIATIMNNTEIRY